MTIEDEKGYEIAGKYLRKKYGDDYVDFLETEGQSYLDGLEEGRSEGYEQGKNNERELQCGKKNYEKDISRLEKENAELESDLESEARAAGELESQVEALEEELQAERYMLKCRDDELSEARANLENLDKRLRQVTTERSLAAEDFKNTQPGKITDYYIKLSERAKEQIKLEDLCWEDEEAKIKLDVEENKSHAKE